jgi:hypothetical protein
MGRILKAVYSHIYSKSNGEKIYFSNGIPQVVMNHIDKKYINDINTLNPHNCIEEVRNASSMGWNLTFNLGNFHYYFINKIGEENIIPVYDLDVNDKDSTYIFPIEIATSINALNDQTSIDLDGNNVEYSIEEIIEPVIEHLRANRIKIVICNIQDPCHFAPSIRDLELRLRKLGVSESNLVFIFGNKFLNHTKDFPDSLSKFTYGNLALQQQARGMDDFPRPTSMGYTSDIVRDTDLDKTKIRPKKFLCFNRSMRSHRYYIAYMAMKYNLLDNSIFSFVNVPDHPENIRHNIETLLGESIADDDFNKLLTILPYEIDTAHLTVDEKRGFVTDNNKKEWYTDTYFHIISETSFYGPIDNSPFFSEKTYRPIINLQPFIMIGDFGSLQQLRNLGFKTFSQYIDESYDLEPDYLTRMQLIQKEILKLNALSFKELHNLYYSMTDILIYNRDHFASFKNTNPYKISYEFIQQL